MTEVTAGIRPPLLSTEITSLPLFARGKVRDTFDLGDRLLMVASDRISAFDVVLPQGIPDKGRVLTQLSKHWFDLSRSVVDNHLISTELDGLGLSAGERAPLEGRSMVVHKAKRVDAECVVRGYLAGSGWAEYQRDGTVSGLALGPGLRESDRLPEPIFTPSTKADVGHDENISYAELENLVGKEMAEQLRTASLGLYRFAADHAEKRGIILADTKFEFGLVDGRLIVIDEVLTPDSSRFWEADTYQPGQSQPSFDKQFVRDYLSSLGWDRNPPAPPLPEDVVQGTRSRYLEAFSRITGHDLPQLPGPA